MEQGSRAFMFMIVLSLAAMTVNASGEDFVRGSSFDATLLTYQPVPAQPGDLVTVYMQVTNLGSSPTRGGSVTIIDAAPFTAESETERIKEFPPIPGLGSVLVTTRVRIDKSATEGTNYLTVSVKAKGNENTLERRLPITIQGRSGALAITSVSSDPKTIAPGETATVTLEVANIGETRLRNVDVALDLSSLSMAPSGSSNTKTIGFLEGGKSASFRFDIIAYPGALANAYQVPVTLSYEDEQGNAVTQQKTFGLVVGSEPELLVYLERNDLSGETLRGDIVVRFVNRGLTEIKLLEMEVLRGEEVTVLGDSSILYVGNIDVDDYESAETSLKLKQASADVPVKVTYRDALNRQYEETFLVHVDAKKGNGKKAGATWLWLLLLVAVIGGAWWWRRRSRKRR